MKTLRANPANIKPVVQEQEEKKEIHEFPQPATQLTALRTNVIKQLANALSKNLKTFPKPNACEICFEAMSPLIMTLPCAHWCCATCYQSITNKSCAFCRNHIDYIYDFKQIAAELEQCLYTSITPSSYSSKARSLILNMSKEYASQFIFREISPQTFVNLTVWDLASDELKKIRLTEAHESLMACMLNENMGAVTDMFTCGKCKGKLCTYYQLQTRSSDEPMTTFVSCLNPNCRKKWRQ
jgi:transcription elongation factor S-II